MEQKGDRSHLLRRRRPRLGTMRGMGRADSAQRPGGSDKLKLSLLDAFSAFFGTCAVKALPKKAQALLAYVALHEGRPIPREQLATLLWPENGNVQARRSLRECLMA